LHLQLKRFEFDMMREMTVKVRERDLTWGNANIAIGVRLLTCFLQINDRHEFPLEIDLEPYLSPGADKSMPHKYILQG
jgi:ubiquitin carboxyl-terminal hydrolase 7